MVLYPQDFTRLEYIDFITKLFKSKYPYFTHPQIAIPVAEVINNITEFLLIPHGSVINVDDYYRIRVLSLMPEVRAQLSISLGSSCLYYSLLKLIDDLYFQPMMLIKDVHKDSLNNVALWLVREGEGLDFLNQQEELYKTFLQDMIKHCVAEIAKVANANTPREIKEEYKKSPLSTYIVRYDEDLDSGNPRETTNKKTVTWNPQLETRHEVPSRKRRRDNTTEDFDGVELKKRKQEDDREMIQKIIEEQDFIKTRYWAVNGCVMECCCGKLPCARNEKKLGQYYEKGNTAVIKSTFLARFWYQRAAIHMKQQAKMLLDNLPPAPFYPKQYSRFWQPVPESTTQGESSQSQEQIKNTHRSQS